MRPVRYVVLIGSACLVSACGGGSSGGGASPVASSSSGAPAPPTANVQKACADRDIVFVGSWTRA